VTALSDRKGGAMNGKTTPGAFGVKSVLLALAILFLLQGRGLASEYRVIVLSGEVTVRHGEEKARAVSQGDLFGPGDTLQTGRDSTVRFEDSRMGYMVYPYSLVTLGEKPGVLWGKLSNAPDGRFMDIRFFLYPRPAQGKTLKIGLRAGSDGLEIHSCIRSETGYRKEIFFFPLGDGVYRSLTGFDIGLKPERYLLEIHAEKGSCRTTIVYPFYLNKGGQVRPVQTFAGKTRAGEEARATAGRPLG
jgi:hypothetical protein